MKKKNTDTPRTDAAAVDSIGQPHHLVSADFARGLEREISEITLERDRLAARIAGIYDYANNTLQTASRDIGDWVDDVEHIGLLAADDADEEEGLTQ